jgi:hypothetical protein
MAGLDIPIKALRHNQKHDFFRSIASAYYAYSCRLLAKPTKSGRPGCRRIWRITIDAKMPH